MKRPELTKEQFTKVIEDVLDKLAIRLAQKGNGIAVSSHEVLGIVAEEYDELIDAVRANDKGQQRKELIDLSVAAFLGIASIDSGDQDW